MRAFIRPSSDCLFQSQQQQCSAYLPRRSICCCFVDSSRTAPLLSAASDRLVTTWREKQEQRSGFRAEETNTIIWLLQRALRAWVRLGGAVDLASCSGKNSLHSLDCQWGGAHTLKL